MGEAEDREAEAAKLPTGGLWLGATAFVVLIVGTRIGDASPAPVMRGLSVTLLGLAVIFGGLAFVQLRRYGASTTVAQRGLYAIVRHPQYLGADFLAWGLATSAPHWGTILPAVALTAALSYQARVGEGSRCSMSSLLLSERNEGEAFAMASAPRSMRAWKGQRYESGGRTRSWAGYR